MSAFGNGGCGLTGEREARSGYSLGCGLRSAGRTVTRCGRRKRRYRTDGDLADAGPSPQNVEWARARGSFWKSEPGSIFSRSIITDSEAEAQKSGNALRARDLLSHSSRFY